MQGNTTRTNVSIYQSTQRQLVKKHKRIFCNDICNKVRSPLSILCLLKVSLEEEDVSEVEVGAGKVGTTGEVGVVGSEEIVGEGGKSASEIGCTGVVK